MQIAVTDLHSGGGLIRVVEEDQLPPIIGKTLLEKRQYFRENLDYIRKFLLHEPHGHEGLYGIVVVKATIPEADVGLILLHNAGYGSFCGHGSLALGRYLVDKGHVSSPASPETQMTLECPCGPVKVYVEYENGRTGKSRFHSVPSYIFAKDVTAEVPGYGKVTSDICYGGAFFAHVKASDLGLDLERSPLQSLIDAADTVTHAFQACVKITHPESENLAILMGTSLVDDNEEYSDKPTTLFCVFADKQVERSPCGSGCAARVAQLYQRGLLPLGRTRKVRGPAGDHFTVGPVYDVEYGDHKAVVAEVAGRGFYAGTSTLMLEEGDEIGKGFLLGR